MNDDRAVVEAFVAYLEAHRYPGIRVECRPEDDPAARSPIDAIAGPLAIEHTSIDVLPNQRRNEAWFEAVVGGLSQELSAPPETAVRVSLEYGGIRQGQNWSSIRSALKTWLIQEGLALPYGAHMFDSISGIPVRVHLRKSKWRAARLSIGLLLPDDATLGTRLQELLGRKAAKLALYQATHTTVLLLESADLQLMDEGDLVRAIVEAFPSGCPAGVHEVWYADTSIASALEFRELTHELRALA